MLFFAETYQPMNAALTFQICFLCMSDSRENYVCRCLGKFPVNQDLPYEVAFTCLYRKKTGQNTPPPLFWGKKIEKYKRKLTKIYIAAHILSAVP